MCTFTIGDKVKNVCATSKHYGDVGEVVDINGENIAVEYEDGFTGTSSKASKHYQLYERAEEDEKSDDSNDRPWDYSHSERSQGKPMLQSIRKFVNNLALSANERLLRKYNLKTDCGEYTPEAKELIINFICKENEGHLVEMATKYDEEVKAEKKGE